MELSRKKSTGGMSRMSDSECKEQAELASADADGGLQARSRWAASLARKSARWPDGPGERDPDYPNLYPFTVLPVKTLYRSCDSIKNHERHKHRASP